MLIEDRAVLLALALSAMSGCAPTALEIREDHPASASAPAAPQPEVAASLRGDPAPLPDEEEGGHMHHHHHHRAPEGGSDASE